MNVWIGGRQRMTNGEQAQQVDALLRRAMDFVAACRGDDADGDYPHVGDLQWWARDGSLDDPDDWRFWQDAEGNNDAALGMAVDGQISYVLHPRLRTRDRQDLQCSVRAWALRRLEERARLDGGATPLRVQEDAAGDDPATMALLEREGYTRGDWYHVRLRYALGDDIPAARLPTGFVIRHVTGEVEVEARAALHRDSFYPYTSRSDEESTARYRRAMRMPGYDSRLDLVVAAPDGTLAAGCLCWPDRVNRSGLFEPVGTRPEFRRWGLATALMLEGLRRLRAEGAVTAYVSATHPGDSGDRFPAEFTSSRLIFRAVGFELMRNIYWYRKEYHVESER